jgi:hypothetical protein
MEDSSKQVSDFLTPDLLKEKLIFMSMYITTYENFKSTIIENVKFFYCNGFNENGFLFSEYEEHVLSKSTSQKNRQIKATLNWFKEHGAVDDKDILAFKEITNMRNDFAHKMLEFLFKGLPSKSNELFEQIILLFEKITKWWIKEIEIPTNPDMNVDDYHDFDNEATSIGIIFLKMMADIAQNNNENYIELYKLIKDGVKNEKYA